MSRKKYYRKENRQQFFDEMVEKHGQACLICRKEVRYLVIDHDHETGLMRGILCMGCNGGLGMFKDSPELLRDAANYLETMTLETPIIKKVVKTKPSIEEIREIIADDSFPSDRARVRKLAQIFDSSFWALQARISRERRRVRRETSHNDTRIFDI